MSPCGCQNAGAVNIVGGPGINAQNLGGGTIRVTAVPVTPVVYEGSAVIPAGTDLAVFRPATASSATLPPASVGAQLEVWNHTLDSSNMTVQPGGTDVFDAQTLALLGDPVVIVAPGAMRFACAVAGEWMAHAY